MCFMLFGSGTNQQCPACFLFCEFNLGIYPKPYLGIVWLCNSLMPPKQKNHKKKYSKILQNNNLSFIAC